MTGYLFIKHSQTETQRRPNSGQGFTVDVQKTSDHMTIPQSTLGASIQIKTTNMIPSNLEEESCFNPLFDY